MIEIRLGDRYAMSILELAKERKEVEPVQKDFELILSVCKSNPDFVNMLKSPIVRPSVKQTILDEIFKGKLSELTSNLIEIIVRKRREAWLADIAERYLVQYDRMNKITRGVLTSAFALSEEHKKAIKELVEKEWKTDFVMTEEIDEELIGGFSLRIGDRMFDGSIASQLRELKQDFEHNPYVKQI